MREHFKLISHNYRVGTSEQSLRRAADKPIATVIVALTTKYALPMSYAGSLFFGADDPRTSHELDLTNYLYLLT